ncbi:hypothetical protein BN946_scf184805.g16 [Trametes cinnabarina]|uniref:DUF6589 domain-containing protein n=1 Tax=Pycnoporus cinnabarinus TaxID=5643 RepID=A0A060S359_PYCCI|nr:hypothetical protein BN946_scf184805.g16 [Trametes cinnabarina]
MFRAAEQIIGMCATAFSLFRVPQEHLKTARLLQAFQAALPLSFKDILLTREEMSALRKRLIWTVMNVIVQHGGSTFVAFKDALTSCTPPTGNCIPLHKTDVFPMPAMEIDESSTTGNAQVLDAMFTEMGHDTRSLDFNNEVCIVFGDQLSMARVRAVTNTCVGHNNPSQSYLNIIFAPGFFHYQMAATHGVLETHWGDTALGARNPGSLSFHNTVLHRKPIVLSSLPLYRTCRDLIFVSLYARVLHCLELVSGHKLADYARYSSFEDLKAHAATIVDRAVPEMLSMRMLYCFSVMAYSSGLLLRHFADAVKNGSSDHLIAVLKLWALGFCVMGRVKYAYEILHLLHNLMHVWPPEIWEIIMNNWLVNTTGNANGFIPVDLLQEHLNYWIKAVYTAHGSNASWEWLRTISPCIEVLRRLADEIGSELGTRQGIKHHSPDLAKDISALMDSLRNHHVTGIHALAGPLAGYNAAFRKTQERRLMKPIVGDSTLKTFGTRPSDSSLFQSGPPDMQTHGTSLLSDASSDSASSDHSDSDSEIDSAVGEADGGNEDSELDAFFTLDTAEDVELVMDGY